jgi:hypothetical protein
MRSGRSKPSPVSSPSLSSRDAAVLVRNPALSEGAGGGEAGGAEGVRARRLLTGVLPHARKKECLSVMPRSVIIYSHMKAREIRKTCVDNPAFLPCLSPIFRFGC